MSCVGVHPSHSRFSMLCRASACRSAIARLRALSTTAAAAQRLPGPDPPPTPAKEKRTPLADALATRIMLSGKLSVAEFMTQVLTNSAGGYYMHRDVFGSAGDFTTSPEISPVFGEILGAWFVHHWRLTGRPSAINLLELGPGRGTLMHDILRVFRKFDMLPYTHVHLVETSPKLRELQASKLGVVGGALVAGAEPAPSAGVASHASSVFNVPVSWHRKLETVPARYTLLVAHEFFDALPVYCFVKKEKGWRELLVDIDESATSPYHFRFVVAPGPTLASTAFIAKSSAQAAEEARVTPRADALTAEICPDAFLVMKDISKTIQAHGGAALVVDYGGVGPLEMTLRAFRNHQLAEVLSEPGLSDLTADVDFGYLASAARPFVDCFGPVPQGHFLQALGMRERVAQLCEKADEATRASLQSGMARLISPSDMGGRFKVMGVSSKGVYSAAAPAPGFL